MGLKKLKRIFFIFSFLCCFLLLSGSYSFSAAIARSDNLHTVTYVIDGDTVIIDKGERVRYLGINTPEKDEYYFSEARNFNLKMVMGKKVRLEVCSEQERDKYGRLLATVFVDGADVCSELVKNGYARTLAIPPCGKGVYARYAELQKSAIFKKLGLWQGEKIINASDAGKYIGEKKYIIGKVIDFFRGEKALFFNFGRDYRKDFSFVIFLKHLNNFKKFGINPEKDYPGHSIIVRGKIKEYKGPEIIAIYPTDVEILD